MQALQSSTYPYQEYVWERKRGEREEEGGRAWKNGDGGGDEDGDWPLFCCRVCCIDLFDCILFHLYQCTEQILFIGLNHTQADFVDSVECVRVVWIFEEKKLYFLLSKTSADVKIALVGD